MQYYTFREACATKETGSVSPQIQKWKFGYNDDKVDSYYSYYKSSVRGSVFPDFLPDMDALVMHGKAKPTDLISSGLSIGFVISEKLKVLFEQFNFPPHRFFPTKILYKESELNSYYLMHIVSNYYLDYLDVVDYNKSVFIITGIAGNNPLPVVLKSKEDFLEKSDRLQKETLETKVFRNIKAEKICFNEQFDKNLDCFRAPFGVNYFISQRLKYALMEGNITGYEVVLN